MYRIIIIGHNRPSNPEYPEAVLPEVVQIWDSTKIPEALPPEMRNVEMVFLDSAIPSSLQRRLDSMFPGKTMRLSSTALFHARLRLYFPELADEVIYYLSEKPDFPYAKPPEENPRGSIRYQTKYPQFR